MKKLLVLLLWLPLLFSCVNSLEKEITQEMINDGYTGKGTQIRGNNTYVGEWKDGKKHGQGTYTSSNGDRYVGEWENGKENGQGIMVYSDSVKYEGEWNDGEWHGQGIYTFTDGKIWEGLFENGTYIPPSYCNVLINKLNRHSEDNNDELEILVEEYVMTLNAYDALLYYEKEEECYDEYLINYGEEIP